MGTVLYDKFIDKDKKRYGPKCPKCGLIMASVPGGDCYQPEYICDCGKRLREEWLP